MYLLNDNSIRKAISIATIITFIFTNTAYGASSRRSFFKNKKVDYKKLSTQREEELERKKSTLQGEDAARKQQHKKQARRIMQSHLEDLSQIHIPSELGRVTEVYQAPQEDAPLVVHIQDLHTNPEGQFNEASILEILIKDYKLGLICSEGAEGEVDTSSVSSFPDAEVREKTARLFVNSGELTAEEYLSITKYPDMPIWGVEDKDIYFKNIIDFNKIMRFSPRSQVFIGQAEKALKELRPKIYSKELLNLDQKEQDYEDEKIETDEYLKHLASYIQKFNISTSKYKNITLLNETMLQESSIDQKKIMQDSQNILLNLQTALSGRSNRKAMDGLMVKAQLFKEQKISPFSFYSYLKDLALKHMPDKIANYPDLNDFVDYLTKVNSLDTTQLFNEMEDLSYEVKQRVAKTDEQKTLITALRNIKFLEGFFNLKVSNEELSYYLENRESHKVSFFETFLKPALKKYNISAFVDYNPNLIDLYLEELEDFYEVVKQRDVAMIKNATSEIERRNAKVAALIAGGFHTKGLTRMLREKGYSYIVVSPFSSTEIDEENYHYLLSGKRKPISELIGQLNGTLRVIQAFAPDAMIDEWNDDIRHKVAEAIGVKAGKLYIKKARNQIPYIAIAKVLQKAAQGKVRGVEKIFSNWSAFQDIARENNIVVRTNATRNTFVVRTIEPNGAKDYIVVDKTMIAKGGALAKLFKGNMHTIAGADVLVNDDIIKELKEKMPQEVFSAEVHGTFKGLLNQYEKSYISFEEISAGLEELGDKITKFLTTGKIISRPVEISLTELRDEIDNKIEQLLGIYTGVEEGKELKYEIPAKDYNYIRRMRANFGDSRNLYAEIHGKDKKDAGFNLSVERLGLEGIADILEDAQVDDDDAISADDIALMIKVIDFGKGSVFRFWNELNTEGKTSLIAQLGSIDLERVESLYKRHIVDGINDTSFEVTEESIGTPAVKDLRTPTITENFTARQTGEAALKRGEFAVLETAGGAGARFGYGHSKSLFPASQILNKPLAQMRAEKIRAIADRNGKPVPWILMTSDADNNHNEVVEFFEKNIVNGKYFNQVPVEWVSFRRQVILPQVTDKGELILQRSKASIAMGGFGHGDARDHILMDPDTLSWLDGFGTKYVILAQNDNAFMQHSTALGHHIKATKDVPAGVEKLSMITVEKAGPKERVGMCSIFDESLGVLEYNQVPSELSYITYLYMIDGELVVFLAAKGGEYKGLLLNNLKKYYSANISDPEWVDKYLVSIDELPDSISFEGTEIKTVSFKEKAELWLRLGNLNQQIWSLDCFKDTKHPLPALPTVVARGKKVAGYDPRSGKYGEQGQQSDDRIPANKFERMDFHGFVTGKIQGALILVDRPGGFAPIKNPVGSKDDNPDTAKALYSEHDASMLRNMGWDVSRDAVVETTAAFAYLDGSGLEGKLGSKGVIEQGARFYASGKHIKIENGFVLQKNAQFILDVEDEYNKKTNSKIGKNVEVKEGVRVSIKIKGSGRLIVDDGVVIDSDIACAVDDGGVLHLKKKESRPSIGPMLDSVDKMLKQFAKIPITNRDEQSELLEKINILLKEAFVQNKEEKYKAPIDKLFSTTSMLAMVITSRKNVKDMGNVRMFDIVDESDSKTKPFAKKRVIDAIVDGRAFLKQGVIHIVGNKQALFTNLQKLSRVENGIVAGYGIKDNNGRLFTPDGRFFNPDGSYVNSLKKYMDSLSDSQVREDVHGGIMYYDIRSPHWRESAEKNNLEFTVAFARAYAKKLQEKLGKKDGIVVQMAVDCYQKHFGAAKIFVDTLLRTGICDNGGGINYWGTMNGGDMRNYGQLYHAINEGKGGNWVFFTMSHQPADYLGAKLGIDAKVFCGSEVRHCEGVTSGTLYDYIVEQNFADIKHDKPVGNILTVQNFTENNIAVAADVIKATSPAADVPNNELLKGARVYVDMAGSLVGKNLVDILVALGADVEVANAELNPDFQVENITDPNELNSLTKQVDKNKEIKEIAMKTGRVCMIVDPDGDRGSLVAVDSGGNSIAMSGSELLLLTIEDLAKSYKDKGLSAPAVICDMRTGVSAKDLNDSLNERDVPVSVVPYEAGYPFFMRGMANLPADVAVENTTHAFTNPMTNKNWGAPIDYKGYQGGDNAVLYLTYLLGSMVHKCEGRNPVQQLEWIRQKYGLRPTVVDERKPALPVYQDKYKYMIADRMKVLAKRWFTDPDKFWINFNDPKINIVSGVHITNVKTGAMMLVRFSNTGSSFTISGEGYLGKGSNRDELDEMLSVGYLLLTTAVEELQTEGHEIAFFENDSANLRGIFAPLKYGIDIDSIKKQRDETSTQAKKEGTESKSKRGSAQRFIETLAGLQEGRHLKVGDPITAVGMQFHRDIYEKEHDQPKGIRIGSVRNEIKDLVRIGVLKDTGKKDMNQRKLYEVLVDPALLTALPDDIKEMLGRGRIRNEDVGMIRREIAKLKGILPISISSPQDIELAARTSDLAIKNFTESDIYKFQEALYQVGMKCDPKAFGQIILEGPRAARHGEPMEEALAILEDSMKAAMECDPEEFKGDVEAAGYGIGGQIDCTNGIVGCVRYHKNRNSSLYSSLGTDYNAVEDKWVKFLRKDDKNILLFVVGSLSGRTPETMINFQKGTWALIRTWARVLHGDKDGKFIANKIIDKLYDHTPLFTKTLDSLNLSDQEKEILKKVFSGMRIITEDEESGSSLARLINKSFIKDLYSKEEKKKITMVIMNPNLGGRRQPISPNSAAYAVALGIDVRKMLAASRSVAESQLAEDMHLSKKLGIALRLSGASQFGIVHHNDYVFGKLAEQLGQLLPESLGKGRDIGFPVGIQTYPFSKFDVNNSAFAKDIKGKGRIFFVVDIEGEDPIKLDREIEENNWVIRYTLKEVSEAELSKLVQFMEETVGRYGFFNIAEALLETLNRKDLKWEQIDLRKIILGPEEQDPDYALYAELHDIYVKISPDRQPGVESAKKSAKGYGIKFCNVDIVSPKLDDEGLPIRLADSVPGGREELYRKMNEELKDGPKFDVNTFGLTDDKGGYVTGEKAGAVLEKEMQGLEIPARSGEIDKQGIIDELEGLEKLQGEISVSGMPLNTLDHMDDLQLQEREIFSRISDLALKGKLSDAMEKTAQWIAGLEAKAHAEGKSLDSILFDDATVPLLQAFQRYTKYLGFDRFNFGTQEYHKSVELSVGGVDTSLIMLINAIKTLDKVRGTEEQIRYDGCCEKDLDGLYPSEERNLYYKAYAEKRFREVKTESAGLNIKDATEKENLVDLILVLTRAMEIYEDNIQKTKAKTQAGLVDAKRVIGELAKGQIPPDLKEKIGSFRKERPSPDVVSSNLSDYKPSLYTLDETRRVTTVDKPRSTYFSYHLTHTAKRRVKEFADLIKQKFNKGRLKISREDFDYIIENIEPGLINLFTSRELAGLTRYHYIQISQTLLRMIYPDLYEDIKERDFNKMCAIYSELRDNVSQIRKESGFKTALKAAIEYSAVVNILDAPYLDEEKLTFAQEDIESRSIDIGDFFNKLSDKLELNTSGKIFDYLDNAGELPMDMLRAELFLEEGYEVVFVAKDNTAYEDLTVRDVERYLEDRRFSWSEKYRSENKLRVISTDSAISGLNLAQLKPGHVQEYKESILSIYKGGGNFYGTYPPVLTKDSFYIFTIKEPIQTAVVMANGVSKQELKTKDLVFMFKPENTRGLDLDDLVSDRGYFVSSETEIDTRGIESTFISAMQAGNYGDAFELVDNIVCSGVDDAQLIVKAETLRTLAMQKIVVIPAAEFIRTQKVNANPDEQAIVVIAMNEDEYVKVKEIGVENINIKVREGDWVNKYQEIKKNQIVRLSDRQRNYIEFETKGIRLDLLDEKLGLGSKAKATTRAIASGV